MDVCGDVGQPPEDVSFSDSSSSLWAAFMLTVHINAYIYNESIHGKEEHAT